ncbi:hypothetical protein PG990_011520 [Apiospora arundinis]
MKNRSSSTAVAGPSGAQQNGNNRTRGRHPSRSMPRPNRAGQPRRRPPSPYITNADAGITDGPVDMADGMPDGMPYSMPDGMPDGMTDGMPDGAINGSANSADADAGASTDNWEDVLVASLESQAIADSDDDDNEEAVADDQDPEWEDAPLYQQLALRERERRLQRARQQKRRQ